jgi:N-carbamoyl-L-amino-acid hydrolase
MLRERIVTVLEQRTGRAPPVLPTGAGHDAGILAAEVPTAMLFVRNPTGVSHSPAEHAELVDCVAGVEALAAVLAELAGQ